jgi:adenylate kinase family enzyme
MMVEDANLLILIGHYGVGKTTLAVNLAYNFVHKHHQPISLADIDVNNPYFRSRDWLTKLEENQVNVIMPELEIAYAEMPFLPKGIYSAIQNREQKLILDVGGNDVGTTVLGSLAEQIKQVPYSLYFVVNTFRPDTETKDDIIEKYHQLESISRLRITHILNNSNIGAYTEASDVIESEAIVLAAAKELGVPFLGTTVESRLLEKVNEKMKATTFPIDQIDQLPW